DRGSWTCGDLTTGPGEANESSKTAAVVFGVVLCDGLHAERKLWLDPVACTRVSRDSAAVKRRPRQVERSPNFRCDFPPAFKRSLDAVIGPDDRTLGV